MAVLRHLVAAAAVTSALVTPVARPRPRTRRPVIEEPRVDDEPRVEYDDEDGLVCVIDENGFKSCAPAGPGLEWYEDELVSNEKKLEAVEAKLEKLKAEKKLLVAKQKELTSVYDELRFEVRNAGLNGPILAFVFCAALVALLWKDLFIVISLYENDAYMEADWLPESFKLLTKLPMDFLVDYTAAAVAMPVLTKAATSCVSYLGGDLTAQAVEGRRRVGLLDLPRAARNGLLGFFLHGPLLHFWILFLEGPFARLCLGSGLTEGPLLLVAKVALDQTLFAVTINLAYAFIDGILSDQSPSDAWRRSRQVLVPSVVQSWRFWPLVHLISYSPLIPVDLKVLWIDVMEIVWVAILSATVNSCVEINAIEQTQYRIDGVGARNLIPHRLILPAETTTTARARAYRGARVGGRSRSSTRGEQ